MVDNNDWKAAASVWKANTTNKNKNIAAKCMFNMAVACEIQGHLDAALDWVVQSYYVFKDKNELHAKNCTSYIKVLSQRKLDYKTLDEQLN